jgi:formimidoylglutamate deiminase
LEHVHVGVAIHSLRAVDPGIGLSVIQNLTDPETPIHIHVAEQVPEVEACLVAHGRRSVEWLFDSYPVDHRWCLIHSTHLSDRELSAIAAAKATVGLCPTTEGNLGDGFFRMREFVDAGGRFAIGGDSHVSVDPRDELRLIEYAQRLQRRERVVLGPREQSSGRFLYESAAQGGAAALGIGRGTISVGQPADMTLIDPAHPSIDRAAGDRVLDRFVFCNNGSSPVWGVVVAGKVLRRD